MVFNINFLPAKYGDSIWIEYGNADDPNIILIDGGTGGTKKHIQELIQALPSGKHIELLVVTHIDRDHIEGILRLLEDDDLGFTVGSVWFNGWNHLPGNPDYEIFGAIHGEKLTAAIIKHNLNWNSGFGKKAVVVHHDEPLPVIELKDGLKLTLLSPTEENLEALKPEWEKEVAKANLAPGFGLEEPVEDMEIFGAGMPDVEVLCETEFHEDDSAANGSSIAFLAEFTGKKALFAGDSFPGVILKSLNRLYDGPVPLDLVKLSHHASEHNTSPELIEKLNCKRYAISTNGSIYHHPSQTTVARIIKSKGPGTVLIFNYRTKHNECWDNDILKMKHKYETVYPWGEGIKVSLI